MNYKRELIEKIERLEQERQSIVALHNTFIKLSNILKKDCNIDLKKDLGPITKLLATLRKMDMMLLV